MTKLNRKNYFTLKNTYLSNSKIGDFLKDKNYFYRKHVLGTVEKEGTSALRIGQAVDFYCFNSLAKFTKKYAAVARRSKEPPKGITELPMSEYEEVIALGQKVKEQSAFKSLKGFKFQVILQVDKPIGLFTGLCGMLDGLKIDDNGKAIIFDLKTSRTIDPNKYFWHAVDFGYFRQLAMYTMLVRANYPEVKEVECRHLVIEKDSDGINRCQTFIFDKDLIEREIDRVRDIINDISVEKDFAANDAKWSDAIVIGKQKAEESEGVDI